MRNKQRQILKQRYQQKDEQWGWDFVGMTLGELSENEVLEGRLP